jgi:hypothetical protein
VGVVVVVEVVVVLVVNVSVVFETATSGSVVGASESVTEVVELEESAASLGVTTSAGGTATLVGGGATAVEAVVGNARRVFALFKATVGRSETMLVAFAYGRLDTALHRRPPQHRMIQKRTLWCSDHEF